MKSNEKTLQKIPKEISAEIGLSKRLQAVAAMVTEGNVVCDVGCDHGFVSIYLVKSKRCPRVIAMDVNEGPLQAAREHIAEHLLADYIETRLSDGVRELGKGEAQTLICAGMGGRLMKRILEEGACKVETMQELILQPQSELQGMREYLGEKGYLIVDENMILEEGKYYPMMRVSPGAVQRQEESTEAAGKTAAGTMPAADTETAPDEQRIFNKYGPVLLRKKNPVLKAYLEREYCITQEILDNIRIHGSGQYDRERELQNKRKDIEAALSYFTL